MGVTNGMLDMVVVVIRCEYGAVGMLVHVIPPGSTSSKEAHGCHAVFCLSHWHLIYGQCFLWYPGGTPDVKRRCGRLIEFYGDSIILLLTETEIFVIAREICDCY